MQPRHPGVDIPELVRIARTAIAIGSPEAEAFAAAEHVATSRVTGLLLSGRQGAGKDTVAPRVLARLDIPAVQVRVSDAIRSELDVVISHVTAFGKPQAARHIAQDLAIEQRHAEALVEILWPVTRDPRHGITAHTRTAEVRKALQYHGLDSRSGTDPDYWVRACFRRVVSHLAAGTSVYLTDSRYPNEVDTARALGMFCVRLIVDPEVQAARITARDGAPPDPATLNHHGERVLDDYDGFDVVLDNSKSLTDTVDSIAARLQAAARSRQTAAIDWRALFFREHLSE